MVNNLYDISLFNLLSIYRKENQSFRKEEFKNSNGNSLSDKVTLIDFLIEKDLIEFESDKKLYFLSPETYDLIENSELENFLWNIIEEKERKHHLKLTESKPTRELKYNSIEPEVEREKEPFLNNVSKPVMAAIFTTIIVLLYFIIPFENKPPEKKGLSPEEIEALDNVIMFNQDGDTMSLEEKRHITH